VDEEARGRFETHRPDRDGQVTQAHLGLERPARPDPDEGRPLGDRQDLSHHDLDVVRADPGRHDRDTLTPKPSGDRRELPVSTLELDGFEARGDPVSAVGVTREEDVLGQFAWPESDVVLPFTVRDRNPAIRWVFDAVVRVRQDLSPRSVAASLARNSAEDSPAFSRASSRSIRA